MDKLPYRNMAGTMLHIEKWMEKHLGSSLANDTRIPTGNSPRLSSRDEGDFYEKISALRQLKLDRDSLEEDGLDKNAQDRIYRSFYLYCSGMHEFIREFGRFDDELPSKLWMTFIRLFQHYDIQFQEKFSSFIKQQQDSRTARIIKDQQEKIQRLTQENSELAENLIIAQAQASGEKFESSAVASSSQAMQRHWVEQASYYEKQYQCSKDKVAKLEEMLSAYKETVLQCKDTIAQLATEYYRGKAEMEKVHTKLEGVGREYEELKKKYKAIEGNHIKTYEELGKNKEKIMHLQQARDDLFVTINTLNSEKKVFKYTIENLEVNKQQLINLQSGLLDLVNKMLKLNANLADSKCHYHSLGDYLRLQCEDIQQLLPPHLLTHKFNSNDSIELSACIATLQKIVSTFKISSLCFSDRDYQAHLEELQALSTSVQQMESSINVLNESSFLFNQLNCYTSFLTLLGEKTVDYVKTFGHYTRQQVDVVAKDNANKVYVCILDKLQSDQDSCKSTIYTQSELISDYRSNKIELEGKIEYLDNFRVKYLDLEPKFLKLVEYYKALTKEKTGLEDDVAALKEELKIIIELREQLRTANRTTRGLENDVKERDEHIKYLQAEVRKVSAKVQEQDNKNSVYEGFWEPLLAAVKLLTFIVQFGEERYCKKQAVFTSIEDLNRTNLYIMLDENSIRDRVREVVSALKLQKEIYELDKDIEQKISTEEKDRLLSIIKYLQDIPDQLIMVFRGGDEALLLTEQVKHLQREFESLRSYSAKERARLTRVVLSNSSEKSL